ncbi:MAG: PQQ-binding-like beta-propeller repeat protein [Phycisphaerales bacterium]|nr:PQQ-binding-like beta-propeller repeat protein [Phycisphaerales bacterium]
MLLASTQWTPQMIEGKPAWVSGDPALRGVVHGDTTVASVQRIPAMVMTGDTWAVVGDGTTIHMLPSSAFTVRAMVQIDAPQEWGGIVSALQDNGSQEQGWMLGYRKDRFAFALATQDHGDADGTMTYLTAPEPFELRRWYEVAGTWDGTTQRLWIDGQEVARSTVQKGDVRWPESAPFGFGAYLDSNERYPMQGLLGPVIVQDGDVMEELQSSGEPAVAFWDATVSLEPHTTLDARPPLVRLHFAGEDIRRFAAGVNPGEDHTRVLRLPWNTGPGAEIDADLLVKVDGRHPDGGLLSALSAEDEGWALNLECGMPTLRVARTHGMQVLSSDVPIEPGVWTHISVQADATGASITVNDTMRAARSVAGALRPVSHRHLVVAGTRADVAEGTLAADVHALQYGASIRDAHTRAQDRAAALALLPQPPAIIAGPIIRTLGDSRWSVEWMSDEQDESWLEWAVDDEPPHRIAAVEDGRWRGAVVKPEKLGERLRIRPMARTSFGAWRHGDPHTLDLQIDLTAAGKGHVLHVNPVDALAIETAALGEVQVTVAMSDRERIQALRRAARARGIQGDRFAVHRIEDDTLPYAPWLFNEVHVSAGTPAAVLEQCIALVRPEGGRLYGMTGEPVEGFTLHDDGSWVRGAVDGAKWWARQYAEPGHTSCSGDDLVGGELRLLWWGRPGPRPMLDRGARAPSPLASHGRMFVQGNHAIFCLDAYNGSPRWTLSMPGLRRTNVPRDTTNMAIGPDGDLHLAVRDDLWVLDGETGRVERVLHTASRNRDWGVVDPLDDGGQLTTAVPRAAMYTGAEGEWYDSGGEESWRVACDRIVRLDSGGAEVWSVEPDGWILHSSIARDDTLLYFIEVPEADTATPGRLPQSVLAEQDLVCVDMATGEEHWRQSLDVGHFDRMTYVLLHDGVVLVCGSSDRFHTLAFDAVSGEHNWAKDHPWARDHHGGPLQHPVIVGDIVYVESCAYDLHTGDLLRTDIPQGRGCGTKTASNHLLAFRHHFHSFWDPQSNEWTEWTGTRGGCWLGLLPAGGMLLGPETSSGCSCTHAIQTSMAWIPRHLDPKLAGAGD